MNFLVLFPIIATAMAASIPHEGYSTNHVPSLNQRFPVAADSRQSEDFGWLNTAMSQLLALPLSMTVEAINIKMQMLECVFNPNTCSFSGGSSSYLSVLANALANTDLQGSATRDANQKNYVGPYVNSPYVAGKKEIPNVYRPSVGSFMPYLDSITRFNYPSFVNTAAQPAKGVVPASTVLDTTA